MEEKQSYRISKLYNDFLENEKSGGLLLILCTICSLLLANSHWGHQYTEIWHSPLLGQSFEYWINDGLMTIFFLLIGLELEREVYIGELSSLKEAMLPVIGAFGGMIIPACIYLLFNYGLPSQSGSGIPMATDIAFALGILSLLGKRVPLPLKIFLTALAVIDDLGAILVIAIFYSSQLSWLYLGGALIIWAILFLFNRLKIYATWPYIIGGVVMWFCMLHSGVHATISGVILAFAIPFADGAEGSISYKLQKFLHKPVAFIILPLFALANTAIHVDGQFKIALLHPIGLGIMLGLVLGKPIGIFLFTYVADKLGFVNISGLINKKMIFGAAILGGIGFTMSIFITILAFDDIDMTNNAKLVILLSSTLAAIIGYIFLYLILPLQSIDESK